MTVYEAMTKYGKSPPPDTEVYVKELEDLEWRNIDKYFDSEVLRIYDHNGCMVCEVQEAK